jgi:hypothetical protein
VKRAALEGNGAAGDENVQEDAERGLTFSPSLN